MGTNKDGLRTLTPGRTKLEKTKESVPEMAVASESAPKTCNPNARYGMASTYRCWENHMAAIVNERKIMVG
jgi:hypothetical protein